MIRFNLDKTVQLSYYEQIKWQLLSAIYCGKIQEGDRLPSIRELSEDLRVNFKTVRGIYVRLAEENYIELVKGSGAYLQKRRGESYEEMRRNAVYRLLSEVSDKVQRLGMTPQKFAQLLDSYSTGNNTRRLKLAVVDHEEEAFIFSRELSTRLRADVFPISLDLVETEASLQLLKDCDYMLTTSWHLEEVGRLAECYKKRIVEIKPSHEIYREILGAARDRNVAVIIRDPQTMHASLDIFMNIFYPSTTKKFWIAPIEREDLISTILKEADLIFVSPMCWDEVRRRTPADMELKTYANFISEETVSHLKELQLLG